MKEASGELSMTAVAVVAIAAVGVLFTTLIWPSIKGGLTASTNCSAAFNCGATAAGDGGCDETVSTCKCNYYIEGTDGKITTGEVTCENPNYKES